jgi:hypothetical protein
LECLLRRPVRHSRSPCLHGRRVTTQVLLHAAFPPDWMRGEALNHTSLLRSIVAMVRTTGCSSDTVSSVALSSA